MMHQRTTSIRKDSASSSSSSLRGGRRCCWFRRKQDVYLLLMILLGSVCLLVLTHLNHSVLLEQKARERHESLVLGLQHREKGVARRDLTKKKQLQNHQQRSAATPDFNDRPLAASYKKHLAMRSTDREDVVRQPRQTPPPVEPPQKTKDGGEEEAVDVDNTRYHVVFSTSCSKSGDWQSYLFFYLAMAHGQRGDVTHIVSGCNDKETEDELRERHAEQHTRAMNENFLIHFTPEYSDRKDFETTKYWNKPFGLKHWMEHRFGFEYDTEAGDVARPTEYDDDIIILIDPDMLMTKPFRNNFTDTPKHVWSKYFQRNEESLYFEVKQGQVIAQEYAFGEKWLSGLKDFNNNMLARVLGKTDSPVLNMTLQEAGNFHSAGPPYIATARDLYKISHHWTDFLPRYYREKPNMMNEMYSYSMAVAHLGLESQLAKGFMVSDTNLLDGEGWDFLMPQKGEGGNFANDDDLVANACDASRYKTASLPQVLHFCQRYGIGEFFISKYKVPRRTFTCGFPLYEEPPVDVATALYSRMGNFETVLQWTAKDAVRRAANAYMVCSLYKALNEASTFYKDHHCRKEDANYDKSWQYFRVYDRDPHGPGLDGRSKSKP